MESNQSLPVKIGQIRFWISISLWDSCSLGPIHVYTFCLNHREASVDGFHLRRQLFLRNRTRVRLKKEAWITSVRTRELDDTGLALLRVLLSHHVEWRGRATFGVLFVACI